MPIYEYICNNCSRTFARLQKIGADSNGITCPTCSSENIERAVSTFSGGAGDGAGTSSAAPAPSCTGFT
ncbi:MAG: zinc ribbon domain-containing protein [Acidobacteria bacterium]|nr:MAG: zinc ribbon domain-containing protein [Acidobacteriota bacterium]